MQVRPRPQIPSLQQLKELSSTFGPASLIYIFKSLCYMMLQVRCAADMQSNLYFVLEHNLLSTVCHCTCCLCGLHGNFTLEWLGAALA